MEGVTVTESGVATTTTARGVAMTVLALTTALTQSLPVWSIVMGPFALPTDGVEGSVPHDATTWTA